MNLMDALEEFEEALNLLDERLAEHIETSADGEEAAEAVAAFEKIRLGSLKIVQQNFFAYALGTMKTGEMFVVNGQQVSKGWTEKKSKWRHDDLTEEVIKRLTNLNTTDDGEITLTPRQAIKSVMQYAHVDYWRKGKLEELDINPDAYVDLDDEKEIVTVRKAK